MYLICFLKMKSNFMMPFFSIVVPVYNVAPYLCECLNSVLAQTFTDWECVCVDDGSTDGSGAIIDDFLLKSTRFRSLHQSNIGVGATRNRGVQVARGEYILFLDGDDTLAFDTLEVLFHFLEKKKVDILKFDWVRVFQHNQVSKVWATSNGGTVYDMSVQKDAVTVFKDYAGGGLLAWGACYRKELIASIPFMQIPNGEDVLFGTEAICKANTFATINNQCYHYLCRQGSASNQKNLHHLKSILTVVDQLTYVVTHFTFYNYVKKSLFRKVRTLLFGGAWNVMEQLPKTQKNEGQKVLFSSIARYCCYGEIASFPTRVLYWLALYLTRLTNCSFFLRCGYYFCSLLIRCSWIRRMWQCIR